jgi:hypothetical protein
MEPYIANFIMDFQLVLRMKSVAWVNPLPSQNSKPLPRLSMPITGNVRVRFLGKLNPHHPILQNLPHPTTLVPIHPDPEITDPDRTNLLNPCPRLPHPLLKLWILIPSWVRMESLQLRNIKDISIRNSAYSVADLGTLLGIALSQPLVLLKDVQPQSLLKLNRRLHPKQKIVHDPPDSARDEGHVDSTCAKELRLNAVVLSNPTSLCPYVSLLDYPSISEFPALVDCGFSHCFIETSLI